MAFHESGRTTEHRPLFSPHTALIEYKITAIPDTVSKEQKYNKLENTREGIVAASHLTQEYKFEPVIITADNEGKCRQIDKVDENLYFVSSSDMDFLC